MSSEPQRDSKEKLAYEVVGRKGECKWCGSSHVVKAGHNTKKQPLRKCNGCGRRFVPNGNPPRMRTPLKVIALAHEFYFDGLSLRKTRRNLGKAFGIKRNHDSIHNWLTKYPALVAPFLANFHPVTGVEWCADETQVKVKGEPYWVWEVLDSKTRFLLSLIETDVSRTDARATTLFREAKTLGGRPQVIQTDGLGAYNAGISKNFWSPKANLRVKHNVGGMDENAMIERYHNTYKDRYKVMRGFKAVPSSTAINQGFRIHYNFLREHMALGTTPAVAAKIRLPFEDGWGDLMGWAIRWNTLTRLA